MDVLVFTALLVLSCGYAIRFGSQPERMAATMLLAAAVLSFAVVASSGKFQNPEWGIFLTDCALLLGLIGLALNANRYWPMWLASLQFVTVWSHIGFLTVTARVPWAYAIASTIWSFPMLIILAWGTQRHRQRVALYSTDEPWIE